MTKKRFFIILLMVLMLAAIVLAGVLLLPDEVRYSYKGAKLVADNARGLWL